MWDHLSTIWLRYTKEYSISSPFTPSHNYTYEHTILYRRTDGHNDISVHMIIATYAYVHASARTPYIYSQGITVYIPNATHIIITAYLLTNTHTHTAYTRVWPLTAWRCPWVVALRRARPTWLSREQRVSSLSECWTLTLRAFGHTRTSSSSIEHSGEREETISRTLGWTRGAVYYHCTIILHSAKKIKSLYIFKNCTEHVREGRVELVRE